jgi:hypothetical protein
MNSKKPGRKPGKGSLSNRPEPTIQPADQVEDIANKQTYNNMIEVEKLRKIVNDHSPATKDPLLLQGLRMLDTMIPRHITRDISRTSRAYNIPYMELLAYNLSYELAIIALALPDAPSLTEPAMVRLLQNIKVNPIGGTVMGVIDARSARMWRNLDWGDPGKLLEKNAKVSLRLPPSKIFRRSSGSMHVYLSLPGFHGNLTGMSYAGNFAVAINAVFMDFTPQVGALPVMLLREVLEQCITYAEAKKTLSETKLVCPALFTLSRCN